MNYFELDLLAVDVVHYLDFHFLNPAEAYLSLVVSKVHAEKKSLFQFLLAVLLVLGRLLDLIQKTTVQPEQAAP